jgi:hypothetical protein
VIKRARYWQAAALVESLHEVLRRTALNVRDQAARQIAERAA